MARPPLHDRISTIWPLSSSLSLRSLDLSHNEIRSLPDLDPLLNLKVKSTLAINLKPFAVPKRDSVESSKKPPGPLQPLPLKSDAWKRAGC